MFGTFFSRDSEVEYLFDSADVFPSTSLFFYSCPFCLGFKPAQNDSQQYFRWMAGADHAVIVVLPDVAFLEKSYNVRLCQRLWPFPSLLSCIANDG